MFCWFILLSNAEFGERNSSFITGQGGLEYQLLFCRIASSNSFNWLCSIIDCSPPTSHSPLLILLFRAKTFPNGNYPLCRLKCWLSSWEWSVCKLTKPVLVNFWFALDHRPSQFIVLQSLEGGLNPTVPHILSRMSLFFFFSFRWLCTWHSWV